jgi:hypothetical protein
MQAYVRHSYNSEKLLFREDVVDNILDELICMTQINLTRDSIKIYNIVQLCNRVYDVSSILRGHVK